MMPAAAFIVWEHLQPSTASTAALQARAHKGDLRCSLTSLKHGANCHRRPLLKTSCLAGRAVTLPHRERVSGAFP